MQQKDFRSKTVGLVTGTFRESADCGTYKANARP
jgi:hypothetical protein